MQWGNTQILKITNRSGDNTSRLVKMVIVQLSKKCSEIEQQQCQVEKIKN